MKEHLVRTFEMECPLCDAVHVVEVRERTATMMVKGQQVSYQEVFYFCCNSEEEENEFTPAGIYTENLHRARDAYRRTAGLLTTEEIKAIRRTYGLSQSDMANLLGWGEVTITRYETKSIQDEAHDNMLRIVRDNPMETLTILEKNKPHFDQKKYLAIKKHIEENLNQYGKKYLKRQMLRSDYVDYTTKCDFNGFQLLDIPKLECMITYLANRVDMLYKVKLMKLLWYCDVLNYIRYRHAMSGLVYCHEKLGALPVGHYKILDLEDVAVERIETYESTRYRIHPNDKLDLSHLAKEEREIMDCVAAQFKDYKAHEIVDYMHEEASYKNTEYGQVIPFSMTGQIREFSEAIGNDGR